MCQSGARSQTLPVVAAVVVVAAPSGLSVKPVEAVAAEDAAGAAAALVKLPTG